MADRPPILASSEAPDIREVESFLRHEVDLLDKRQFDDWVGLFDLDGYYWAPATPDQESPLTQVSIFYDDRALMTQRISRLKHERIHSQIPHARTVHSVTNAVVSRFDSHAGLVTVCSKFLMAEYRPSVPEGIERLFAGDYVHELVRSEMGFIIKSKKATLINCDSTFSPLALYF
ncbi:aromatic-ring-hydroxylating dioxygenase subunit beta [Paraburkholderia aspalathi]|uniref:aromatic-ring-hydroxylating dioxygenase subunit beta n=1 Tax=Paraburkholderia aspalathi TaxID=1324617 RepID=UPI001B06251D|nr:aromatic-ring-hydroxylating dioxygenase subunit beta [Paraburkholderia aspalathi]CAE6840879.1 p-cumate 2,3-dioxygenase system, small oxygenase component [Paraburkholderia aspalathi]